MGRFGGLRHRHVETGPGPRFPAWSTLLLAGALLAACGGPPGDGGNSPGPTIPSSPLATPSPTATSSRTTTPSPQVTSHPIGNLIASPDGVSCAYVPHGMQNGSDELAVYFHMLLTGASPSQLPGLVAVSATSNTGLATTFRSTVSNQAVTPVLLALRPSDFGLTHVVRITVDSAGEISETDESDNSISVSIPLPSPRPNSTIGNLSCSATAG